jgi:hypothetical protein
MAKSPPEKLAAALRANLKRRKQGPAAQKAPQTGAAAQPLPAPTPPSAARKPPKNSA